MSLRNQNLDRDAMLMLHAAGELSPGEHADFSALLEGDPGLASGLQALADAQESVDAALAAADATLPLPALSSSSLRRLSVAMDQWQVDQLRAAAIAPRPRRRKSAWIYSAAAVAATIVIAVFVLWSRVDDGKNNQLARMMKGNTTDESVRASSDAGDPATADGAVGDGAMGDAAAGNSDSAVAVDNNDAEMGGIVDQAEMQLSRAEVDLATLSTLTDALRPNEDSVTP